MKNYSVIIPTLGKREEQLRALLQDIRSQSLLPNKVVVITAPGSNYFDPSEELMGIPSVIGESEKASAAEQRNLGVHETTTPIIIFLDDDIRIGNKVLEQLVQALEYRNAGGVSARMKGADHKKPGWLSKHYYRLQAGYHHPHYGSRVLGPAITTFPCYDRELDDMIESDWLNSACVAYDSELFLNIGGFPPLEGYSPFEDVHLSLRMSKERPLFFHRGIEFDHVEKSGGEQNFEIGKTFIQNQRMIARDVLKLPPFELHTKLTLHKLWIALSLMRRRPPGWQQRMWGTMFS